MHRSLCNSTHRHTGIISALIMFVIQLNAQTTDIVITAGIQSTLHQQNIGRLYFTTQRIANNALQQKDFVDHYTLTNKSNLFMVAFMGNSLTNYLHQLQENLTADSLVETGNYQFAISVDGKPVYSSNLIPGAPYAKIQDTATIINRPLIDNENGSGSWSESFWSRFMANGGEQALTDGNHVLRFEIRPWLKLHDIETGPLIAAGELQLQVERNPKIDISKISLHTPLPYDGFVVSRDNFNKNLVKELIGKIDAGIFKRINSIVVIKNGKLLLEEYFNSEDRNSLHDPRSVGKSYTSTLTGMAIRDGYIASETTSLGSIYPLKQFENYSPQKDSTTIRQLLTMSSGLDGDDEDGSSPGNEDNMYPTEDWVKFALDLSYKPAKVNNWHYFTAGVIVLGDILQQSVKGSLETYADQHLFKPLHISNYKWEYTPKHVPNTAGGIRMNALDFGKYGQLYKNGGKWNGQQIIPEAWVQKTFTKQVQIAGRNNEYYGYLFWNKSFSVNQKTYEAFYCAGNGGNYILVFTEIPLVVVVTASAYGQPYAHTQVTKMLSEYILPAVRSEYGK